MCQWKLQKAEVEVPESFANDDFLDDDDEPVKITKKVKKKAKSKFKKSKFKKKINVDETCGFLD